MISRPAILLLFPTLILLAACRANYEKYRVAEQNDVVSVEAPDFGIETSQLPDNGANVLETDGSVGRFPTGLTVARVASGMEPESGQRRLHVDSPPVERAAYWNNLLTGQPGVREVVVLRPSNLDPRGVGCEEVLRESRNANCSLCLIYSRVSETDEDAEYVGALWDAARKTPLAAFRVPVTLPPEERHDSDDENCKRKLASRFEADFRAEAELRALVRDTIWELAAHDKPGETRPNPWQTDKPLVPRDDSLKIYTLPASTKSP